MPRRAASGTQYLIKHHARGCKQQLEPARCGCEWSGKYKGRDVVLSKWLGITVEPRSKDAGKRALRRLQDAIDDKNFDPAGERRSRGSGQTLEEYIDDYIVDHIDARKLKSRSVRDQLNVIKAGKLGAFALHTLAEADDEIESWLNASGKARRWKSKTWNEYHALLGRICKRATARKRMSRNPMLAIERRSGVDAQRGELRHFRLDEEIEAKLFEVVDQLNRTQQPNRTTLTQADADAIRVRVEAGALQKALATEYAVSPSVICAIVKGTIWNPARRVTTTTGSEMRRRLMALFDLGLRAGEMLLIQVKHVDWKGGRQAVDKDGTPYRAFEITLPADNTKGGATTGVDQFVIVGTARLSRELEARRFQLKNKPEAYIFGTEAGRVQGAFDRAWQSLFTLAGLDWGRAKGLVWHTGRHEFISRVTETNDPATAQDLARHARLETTQRYIHTRRERRWAAAIGLNR